MSYTALFRHYIASRHVFTVTVTYLQQMASKAKRKLDDEVWDGWQMRSDVREALLNIAHDFVDHLNVVSWDELVDVRLTGSMANFNWTELSDMDLHPIVDIAAIDDDVELVKELLDAKKSTWNEDHDVTVKGHPVEVYAQDVDEPHIATGVYSLIYDEWVNKPIDVIPDPGAEAHAKKKAGHVSTEINKAVSDPDCSSECLTRLRDKIKRMRQCGLQDGGEYSVENLAFKVLRRDGSLEKLSKAMKQKRDDELSLD